MLQSYINKLVETEHPTYKKKPIVVDLIFEGGLFNGSYQLGFLSYIKKLEEKNIIKVKRISGYKF